MKQERLIPLSRVSSGQEMDSVKSAKKSDRRAYDILLQAQQYWFNMTSFRKDRERNKRYTYGDQWKDIIFVNGRPMVEEEYIKQQGNIPLKNNLIRRLVKNVVGAYRSQSKEPICTARDRDEQRMGETMSTVLQCNMQVNNMNEVNARTVEEYCIGGLIMHKLWYGWRNNNCDCWTDYVNPNNAIIDTNIRDFRGWDVSFIGEIHDVGFDDVCGQFAESAEDYKRLAEIYAHATNKEAITLAYQEFGRSKLESFDFFVPVDYTRCRVYEIWRKESKPRYRCHDYNSGEFFKCDVEDYYEQVESVNQRRIRQGVERGMNIDDIPLIKAEWFIDNYWYFYYLSPFGDILKEGETPYAHKSHPYVFKMYPFIDGEIHSFVSDVIDQQRYTNRLITMYDWIMRASAKGLLLFPEECLPEDMSIDDIADEWSRFNGVLMIKTKDNAQIPHQISNNSTNIGIHELLNLQLKFFEDISGVQGVLQGKPGFSGMSASLNAQLAQNASTSLLDLLESFSSFVIDEAYKVVKNIQQFYDTKRVFNIAGKGGTRIVYDPNQISHIEFDLSISENTITPAYRQAANDILMEIWRTGQITLQQMLEHGDFPFADNLLQSLQSQQQQMAQGQAPDQLPQELLNQAQQGADMNAVNQAYAAMTGGEA